MSSETLGVITWGQPVSRLFSGGQLSTGLGTTESLHSITEDRPDLHSKGSELRYINLTWSGSQHELQQLPQGCSLYVLFPHHCIIISWFKMSRTCLLFSVSMMEMVKVWNLVVFVNISECNNNKLTMSTKKKTLWTGWIFWFSPQGT